MKKRMLMYVLALSDFKLLVSCKANAERQIYLNVMLSRSLSYAKKHALRRCISPTSTPLKSKKY